MPCHQSINKIFKIIAQTQKKKKRKLPTSLSKEKKKTPQKSMTLPPLQFYNYQKKKFILLVFILYNF
jgi:hypothetical protein